MRQWINTWKISVDFFMTCNAVLLVFEWPYNESLPIRLNQQKCIRRGRTGRILSKRETFFREPFQDCSWVSNYWNYCKSVNVCILQQTLWRLNCYVLKLLSFLLKICKFLQLSSVLNCDRHRQTAVVCLLLLSSRHDEVIIPIKLIRHYVAHRFSNTVSEVPAQSNKKSS